MATRTTHRGRRIVETPASTRDIIEKKAITILSEKGYDATSMREIAEASGITKPVIYYYFKSKENLCQYLIESCLDEFRQMLRDACDGEAEHVFEQIVRVVEVHFDFCKRHVEFMRFIHAMFFGPDRKTVKYDFRSYGLEIRQMLVGLMKRASKAGVIQPGKEEAAAYYLRGIISAYVMLYVDGSGDLAPGLARAIVTDLVNGLGPHAAQDASQTRSV
jgi:AcrR family transcriptional regulator